jgi:hypothetical protein
MHYTSSQNKAPSSNLTIHLGLVETSDKEIELLFVRRAIFGCTKNIKDWLGGNGTCALMSEVMMMYLKDGRKLPDECVRLE